MVLYRLLTTKNNFSPIYGIIALLIISLKHEVAKLLIKIWYAIFKINHHFMNIKF